MMRGHRRFTLLLAAAIPVLPLSAACAQYADPPEAFVKPPPGISDEPLTGPSPIIPESVLRRLQQESEAQAEQERRQAEDANQAFKERRREIVSRRRDAQVEYQARKDERRARREEAALSQRDRLDEMSRTLRGRIDRDEIKNAQVKADWDAEDTRDDREFRERTRAEFAKWMANAKKQGEMLIAALTLGFGAGGAMASGLTGTIGAEAAAETVTASGAAETAIGASAGTAAGADVAEAAGLVTGEVGAESSVATGLAADLAQSPARLATLESSPAYPQLVQDVLTAASGNNLSGIDTGRTRSTSPEIARLSSPEMRPPMRPGYRLPVRPYPNNREPSRNNPIYTRPNNEVRPPLPDIRELYENSLAKKASDLAAEIQAKLKTWNWLQAGKSYDPWASAPPLGWHPPLLWPQPMPWSYNGRSFMKDNSPPHGPMWFKYREVGPEGFDVYEQDGREIIIPRY